LLLAVLPSPRWLLSNQSSKDVTWQQKSVHGEEDMVKQPTRFVCQTQAEARAEIRTIKSAVQVETATGQQRNNRAGIRELESPASQNRT